MLHILDLPIEVIELIFLHLPVEDQKQFRLVSRSFLRVADSPIFTKNQLIYIRQWSDLDKLTTYRSYINLHICDLGQTLNKFWRIQGCFVKSLHLHGIDMQYKVLYEIINQCPNLEFLTLDDSIKIKRYEKVTIKDADLIESACEKLNGLVGLNLTLSFVSPYTDYYGFSVLTKKVERLQQFSMHSLLDADCKPHFYYALQYFLEKQWKTLTKITFSRCSFVSDEFLTEVLNFVGPQLSEFHIHECLMIFNSLLPVLSTNNFEKLKSIEFNHYTQFFDEHLSVFLQLKSLKYLSFVNTKLNDDALATVAELEHLEGLDLSFCYLLTPAGLIHAFKKKQHRKLFDLRLNSLSSVTPKVLESILPQLPCLKALTLNNCYNLGRNGFVAVTTHCKSLKCLSIQRCILNDNIMRLGIDKLANLTHLDLNGCRCLGYSFIYQLKLAKLEYLYQDYAALKRNTLNSLFKNCPALNAVDLGRQIKLKRLQGPVKYPISEFGVYGLPPKPVWEGFPY